MPFPQSSGQSQELIPCITDGFDEQNLSRHESFTSIAAYKSTPGGIDANLSKKLNKSVTTVSRRVDSARSSFQSVAKAIHDPKLEICKNVALLEEWGGLENDFTTTLSQSRSVATQGATMIEDFLSEIVPYLLRDGQLKHKQDELREYRKVLVKGRNRAGVFANDLTDISKRLAKFKGKWGAHSKDAGRKLDVEIENLQKDLAGLSKSIEKSKNQFRSITAQKHTSVASVSAPTTIQEKNKLRRILEDGVKESKLAIKTQAKSDTQVSKHTSSIQDNNEGLIIVWNLIYDDINVIESQLEICESGNAMEVFNRRVEKLSAQYVALKDILRKYVMALSSLEDPASGPSFWRRLVG